jgi:hypothetical protein
MSTQNDVDMYKNDQVTRRYNEGFKLKVLAELSCGKYTKRQLSMICGLQCMMIKSICDPGKKSFIISFGRNNKNVKALIEKINFASR